MNYSRKLKRALAIYEYLVANGQNADALHCFRNSFIGLFIKLFTLSKYQHTAILKRPEMEQYKVTVFDAQKDGFQERDLLDWCITYGYKFHITRLSNKIEQMECIRRAELLKGTPYSKKDLLVKHIVQSITGGWRFRTPQEESSEVVCSEAIGRCRNYKYSYRMSPKTFHKACLESGELEVLVKV